MKNSTASQRVLILVLPGSSMMTCAAIIDPLRAANRLSRSPLFTWEVVSISNAPIMLTCGIELPNDGVFGMHNEADLLIVVAGFEHQRFTSARQMIALKKVAQTCKTIFGVEAGTWLLARSGIISTQSVTTHWEDLELLKERFSSLKVSSQRYIIDKNIWTCSGATPAFEMMLHYLRTTQKQSLALDVAKVFIYPETSSASDEQTNISLSRLQRTEPRLVEAIRLMETYFEEPISTKLIAENLGISIRTFELLSVKHLGFSPGKYYLRLRLQTARRLVLDSNLAILDIAVRCGFNSSAAFTRAFRSRYNASPLQLRQENRKN
jgi:transcriptional regulator GlxA family with amidase domain